MNQHGISSEVRAKIIEIIKKGNMPQDLAEHIIKRVIKIFEIEKNHIEGEKVELQALVRSMEINYNILKKTCAVQISKFEKLLEKNQALKERIESLEQTISLLIK